MSQRLLYLLKFYATTLLLFIVAKPAFMLYNHVGHEFTIGDVASVVLHGLSLDLSTALYFLLVPFLVCLVSLWWNNTKVLGLVVKYYALVVAIAFALAFVADTCLYEFWGFKLDASCLQYLETPSDAMTSVSGGWMLLRLMALCLVAVLAFWGLHRLFPTLRATEKRVLGTACFILLIPLLVIGIRGGVDESTTNVGQVYYSQNQFLNHSAVNPVFSFLSSFEKSANNIVDYHFFDDDECQHIMEGLYPTDGTPSDTLLTTDRPDIVIILMESAGGIFTEAIGQRTDVMPHLNQLTKEGIYFAQCYANSWRTDRGTVCTLSGYPSFPTSSVMKMPRKTQALPSIAHPLQAEGYATHYLYGGDINFTNMRSYLVATGFEQLTWKKDYTVDEQRTSEWGVHDHITFNTLFDQLTLPHKQPLLVGYSTLSSHEPWQVPVQRFDDPVLNSFFYLDQCIGTFVEKLKKTAQWAHTLVILLPDHGINYQDIDETRQVRNHIPMLWTGGAVKEARVVDVICNQTDLAATLLGQLHLPHHQFRWSRDVLANDYRYPFAVHNYNNGFSVVDSTGFMVYDLTSSQPIVVQSHDANRLVRMGKAILQSTTTDLKQLNP